MNRITAIISAIAIVIWSGSPGYALRPIALKRQGQDKTMVELSETLNMSTDQSATKFLEGIELEVMKTFGSLDIAIEFRRKAYDIYDEYRFPEPDEKVPNRHRHVECVTKLALLAAKEYGLSKYWMQVLWKAALLHDLGQARAKDFPLCAELRTFAQKRRIPFKAQFMAEDLQAKDTKIGQNLLAKLYEEFFIRIRTAGFDIAKYGEGRVVGACKGLFHDCFSRQIIDERSDEFPLPVEDEVKWIVGYHTYPEIMLDVAPPMARILTEILKCADSLDARSDYERRAVYKRPIGFKETLKDAEQYYLGEYLSGCISEQVMKATFRMVHGDNDEFRRLIMRARAVSLDTPWPDYDLKYRASPLEDITPHVVEHYSIAAPAPFRHPDFRMVIEITAAA